LWNGEKDVDRCLDKNLKRLHKQRNKRLVRLRPEATHLKLYVSLRADSVTNQGGIGFVLIRSGTNQGCTRFLVLTLFGKKSVGFFFLRKRWRSGLQISLNKCWATNCCWSIKFEDKTLIFFSKKKTARFMQEKNWYVSISTE
jgi:hypothetical protein